MDGKTPGTLIEPLNQVKSQSQLSRKLESSLILIMQKDWRQSISKYRQLAWKIDYYYYYYAPNLALVMETEQKSLANRRYLSINSSIILRPNNRGLQRISIGEGIEWNS